MMKHVQKIPVNLLFVGLFLLFMGVFSFFRSEIADSAAVLLNMTHEIKLSKAQPGSTASQPAIQIVTERKFTAAKKKNARRVAIKKKTAIDSRFKKPVTVNLSKTKTPIILFDEDFPDWDDYRLKLFTPLREYTGAVWREEKTEIKASTDGTKLFMVCRLYDQVQEEAVTSNTKGNSGQNAWKDDSLEIFLMKNKKSKFYYQYIVSVSGKGIVNYSSFAVQI